MGQLIRRFLDLFHPLFARFFDKQTFYYAACGGANLVSSWLFFFLFYRNHPDVTVFDHYKISNRVHFTTRRARLNTLFFPFVLKAYVI